MVTFIKDGYVYQRWSCLLKRVSFIKDGHVYQRWSRLSKMVTFFSVISATISRIIRVNITDRHCCRSSCCPVWARIIFIRDLEIICKRLLSDMSFNLEIMFKCYSYCIWFEMSFHLEITCRFIESDMSYHAVGQCDFNYSFPRRVYYFCELHDNDYVLQ
jgi:hypothetical protein